MRNLGTTEFKCVGCGQAKTIRIARVLIGDGKFCSRACSNRHHDRDGNKNANWRGGKEHLCPICFSGFWVKPSAAKRRICCSKQCAIRLWKQTDKFAGKNNPAWDGGITVIKRGVRHSLAYRRWREAVMERDKKCVQWGSENQLHADHIKSFSLFQELRFDPSNGRALCWECHKKTPTYGGASKLSVNVDDFS